MAVKKTLTSAIPHNEDGKVIQWELEMEYEQGTEGESDYYASTRLTVVPASVTRDALNAKGEVEKEIFKFNERIEIRLNRKLTEGRSRMNCTAKGNDGLWRWFGHQFYL